MDLIVEGKGSFVGKHQGRLRVMREQKLWLWYSLLAAGCLCPSTLQGDDPLVGYCKRRFISSFSSETPLQGDDPLVGYCKSR